LRGAVLADRGVAEDECVSTGKGLPATSTASNSWNVWWSIYDNSVERFAEIEAEVPEGRYVEATAAVLVTLPGGEGRLMGVRREGHDGDAR
jgi:hypothetical protein